jgi:hypothetical protein
VLRLSLCLCWRAAGLIFGLNPAKMARMQLSRLMTMPAGSTAEWFLSDDKVRRWPGLQAVRRLAGPLAWISSLCSSNQSCTANSSLRPLSWSTRLPTH